MALFTLLLAQVTPSPAPAPWPASMTPPPRPNGPCSHEATIAQQAQPVWPPSLPANTPQLTAMVEVLVGTDGDVEKASIYQSTGYAAADAAAVDAARATTYRPKVVNCQPAVGRYLFKVDFTHSLTRPVSPAPSPTPSAPEVQTPTLTFADGLQRLIGDAPDRFSPDLGRQTDANPEAKTYDVNFVIAGLTQCRINRWTSQATATCYRVYEGPDYALAQRLFNDLEQRLRTFTGKDARLFTESFGTNNDGGTDLAYWPSKTVDVELRMSHGERNSIVALIVNRFPDYKPRPEPSPSTPGA